MGRALLLAVVSVLVAAADSAAQTAERAIPMLVNAEWLSSRLTEPNLVIVQVDQRRDGYDAGHIPGARYLQYSMIAAEVDGIPTELLTVEELKAAFESVGFVDGARIVLYGAPLSASRAWMTLDYLGVSDRAAMLDGGIAAWRAADLAVSTEVPLIRVASGQLTVRPEPQRIIGSDVVAARKGQPDAVLIDVRPMAEYTGEDNGQNGRYLAGHIPGARHLFWETLIHSTADPRLRSTEELRALFEGVGVEGGKDVLLYCTVGMRASMAYFAARMLGYETFLYDGSWADWSAGRNPVETGPDPLGAGR